MPGVQRGDAFAFPGDALQVSPPVAALMPPGQCVVGEQWMALPLVDRRTVAHDVVLLTFRLPDPNAPLGLSTCACLLARGAGAGPSEDPAAAEPTIRPYLSLV